MVTLIWLPPREKDCSSTYAVELEITKKTFCCQQGQSCLFWEIRSIHRKKRGNLARKLSEEDKILAEVFDECMVTRVYIYTLDGYELHS